MRRAALVSRRQEAVVPLSCMQRLWCTQHTTPARCNSGESVAVCDVVKWELCWLGLACSPGGAAAPRYAVARRRRQRRCTRLPRSLASHS